MLRILSAILVWVVLVGGLAAYMRHRDANPVERPAGRAPAAARGGYSLEVTPGFDAAPDAFALVLDGEAAPSLSARFGGREVLRRDSADAGVPISSPNLPGVVQGMNEVVVAATPAAVPEGAPRRHFLQARVFRDGVPLAAETFWADGNARVGGVLRFVAPEEGGSEHGE